MKPLNIILNDSIRLLIHPCKASGACQKKLSEKIAKKETKAKTTFKHS